MRRRSEDRGSAVRRSSDDRGSAVVDFTLVSVLVIALFLIVMQVGVVLHARTVLTAAAAEGARYAANADRDPADGADRTRALLDEGFTGARVAEMQITASTVATDGLETVEVVVRAPLPLLFFPVGPLRLTVRGHALEEGQ